MPMLDEHEWQQMLPHLTNPTRINGIFGQKALDEYFRITGLRETNINAIWHHRRSQFGPPC
jgi:hypothetical protein